ncbi:hypothetical protein HanHA300_Chr03g0091081 [Helianthus annuus]|nr:hypothetical protein HanHA300_Chr03g0091081 [Helianthus annuus]KAJ0767974.1 hypothetical protein HanLR1_Chr03g0096111 [Helianthus annuus]
MPDDQLLAWCPTLCPEPFGKKARVSLIPVPLVRYLHHCIATSISARGKSNERVTKNDLLYLCLVEYFASYSKQQTRSHLHRGELPQSTPFEHLGIKTMAGIHIAVNFPDIRYRFVGLDDKIFVPQPFVHQVLLGAREVDMPHVADVPIGEGDIKPEVDQRQPPQISRRVYHAVRLP